MADDMRRHLLRVYGSAELVWYKGTGLCERLEREIRGNGRLTRDSGLRETQDGLLSGLANLHA